MNIENKFRPIMIVLENFINGLEMIGRDCYLKIFIKTQIFKDK